MERDMQLRGRDRVYIPFIILIFLLMALLRPLSRVTKAVLVADTLGLGS